MICRCQQKKSGTYWIKRRRGSYPNDRHILMDFKLVTEKLLTAFNEHDIHYALIGGLALGAWGVPRGTVDMDFLVNRDDMEKVDAIM